MNLGSPYPSYYFLVGLKTHLLSRSLLLVVLNYFDPSYQKSKSLIFCVSFMETHFLNLSADDLLFDAAVVSLIYFGWKILHLGRLIAQM